MRRLAGLLWVITFACALFGGFRILQACTISVVVWSIREKPADPLFRFVRHGKSGYIDATGKVVIAPMLPKGDNFFGEFHEGLMASEGKDEFIFYSRSGAIAFHAPVRWASGFFEGLAAAEDLNTAKWGFLDKTGQFQIPPKYFQPQGFSEGLARVSVNFAAGGVGYIDHSGTFVIPPTLSYGSNFHDGLVAVVLNGPCQIVNGGSCGPPEFSPMKTGYDCKWVFIDKTGTPISDLRFDYAEEFSEGRAPIRIGNDWGYADGSGQVVISPRFRYAGRFSEGLAAVLDGDKFGYIDRSGNSVIPAQFASASEFSEGRAIVSDPVDARLQRFIDKTGKPAFPGSYAFATPFTYGLADVQFFDGTCAWIDRSGKTVLAYRLK